MATLTTPEGSYRCIVTTGYFSNQLKLYWTTDPVGKWTDKAMIHSRVIGGTSGHVFDIQITDLNNDGNPDFLVTTNGNNDAAVYAFEVPRDFRTDNFVKHILMSGFHTGGFLPGSGAPGSAQVIKDTNYYENE
ncbi:hypothetical protein KUTeg_007989 [Tegillarca granosa]|uniref:Uncharacterized protein n=1 Tax=Tegillarca granosa TaxID=220873 RepID=A0ABQ9FEW8_TEGGR|nr:hypothetical protein KUTeg_007989 [Tegillarca granosa]